jgi:imidazolonepropionase-like amidohydrolase
MKKSEITGLVFAACAAMSLPAAAKDTAIIGATVIDGNGGAPIHDAVIVVTDGRISAIGARGSVKIPTGATEVDAKGLYAVPGFIDTNVHLSLYGGQKDRYETLAKYWTRENDIVLEAAQIYLTYGVTTVRDSYGYLTPLTQVRDQIAAGKATGARVLAAGNIVGWGGPYSVSFSQYPQRDVTRFQAEVDDAMALDGGETLADMTPEELRVAINKYLDLGPDFVKFGGTSHWGEPTYIGFSPEAQKVMVDEAHKRNRGAETHSTTIEGERLSVVAGVDLIQHCEATSPREMPDELVNLIVQKHVICSMLASSITGEAWERHVKKMAEEQKKIDEAAKKAPLPQTLYDRRKREMDLGMGFEFRRINAKKIIKAGGIVSPGTDNYWSAAPEFQIDPKPQSQDHGIGTLMAIEGFVELGMTPAQAITAGTKNGAIASRMLKDIGTLEKGKIADIVLLDADPLADIHNIRKTHAVMQGGTMLDLSKLPEQRVLSKKPEPKK